MHGLPTMHRLNNTSAYKLTEQEISNIMRDPMFPAHMAVEASLMYWPDPIPASEQVRLWKALSLLSIMTKKNKGSCRRVSPAEFQKLTGGFEREFTISMMPLGKRGKSSATTQKPKSPGLKPTAKESSRTSNQPSSINPMQGAIDAYEQAVLRLRRGTVNHKNTQSLSLDSTTPKESNRP